MEKVRIYVNGIFTKDGRKVVVVKRGDESIFLDYKFVVMAIADCDKKEYDAIVKRNVK